MFISASSLADLPLCAAHHFGNKLALHSNNREFTFVDLERYVCAVAESLARRGVKRADRVVLHLPNNWQWIVSYYAIARIGAIVVPANILLVAEEIQFIVEDCRATAIISIAKRLVELHAIDCIKPPQLRVSVGAKIANAVEWDELLCAAPKLDHAPVDPHSTATIAYTSGTTGRPKGAVLTHRNVILNTAMTANMHVRTAADTVVTALPCSHVYGNVVMNGAFLCGYTLVLLERFDAEIALAAIQRHQATLFEGVPTMYYYILGLNSLDTFDLSSLTRATVGGQTMPIVQLTQAQKRLGCPLLELWGMTEIAGLGTTHPAYAPARLGSIGQALPLSECRICNLEDFSRPCELGQPGELTFRGPTVMQEYLNRAKDTKEVLLPGGWLRTGDIAYEDEDGYLFVVDRVKEMIITAGYNIYPSELERILAQHPVVQFVAVGAVPDEAKGELAHAYVVLKAGVQVDESELLEHCRAHLAAYKIPKRIHFVADLPKTSTGKIIRRALHTLNAQLPDA